jgi:hypothetical protein
MTITIDKILKQPLMHKHKPADVPLCVPYVGATADVDLGAHNLTTVNLILGANGSIKPSAANGAYSFDEYDGTHMILLQTAVHRIGWGPTNPSIGSPYTYSDTATGKFVIGSSVNTGNILDVQNTIGTSLFKIEADSTNVISSIDFTALSFTIGTNTLNTTEWAYLDGQDQAVKTTSNVTHNNLTLNGGTVTLSVDTNFVLSGGVNGVSFDTNTLSVDALNHRVGILTTTPGASLETAGDIYLSKGAARTIKIPDAAAGVSADNLTIAAGNAVYSGGLAYGGDLILKAGNPNTGAGSGNGNVKIYAGDNTYQATLNGDIIFYGGNGQAELLRLVGDTGRSYIPGISGTTGQGYFTGSVATPLGAFQTLDLGGITYNFFATNKYYTGSAWADMGQSRLGSSFQMYNDAFTFYTFNTAATYTARFTATSTGVSIGTSLSPGSLLDVNGGTSPTIMINNTATTGYSALNFQNTTGAFQGEIFVNGSAQAGFGGANSFNFYTPNVMTFMTGGTTERLRIDTAGNFGFGTTAPLRRVDINEASGNCLRLIYNDSDGSAAYYSDFLMSSAGNLSIQPSGVNLSISKLIAHSTTAGITASTTQTQGQGALTTDINQISVCANDNDTVTLPTSVAGYRVVVINSGAKILQVFPASGDDLGAGVNTSTTLATGKSAEFISFDSTTWVETTLN